MVKEMLHVQKLILFKADAVVKNQPSITFFCPKDLSMNLDSVEAHCDGVFPFLLLAHCLN